MEKELVGHFKVATEGLAGGFNACGCQFGKPWLQKSHCVRYTSGGDSGTF